MLTVTGRKWHRALLLLLLLWWWWLWLWWLLEWLRLLLLLLSPSHFVRPRHVRLLLHGLELMHLLLLGQLWMRLLRWRQELGLCELRLLRR